LRARRLGMLWMGGRSASHGPVPASRVGWQPGPSDGRAASTGRRSLAVGVAVDVEEHPVAAVLFALCGVELVGVPGGELVGEVERLMGGAPRS
jgi:hypothetical protein